MYKEDETSINYMRLNKNYLDLYYSPEYQSIVNYTKKSLKSRLKRIYNTSKNLGVKNGIKKSINAVRYKLNPNLIFDHSFTYNPEDNLELKENTYNDFGKVAVYTAVFGGYDSIKEPMFKNPQCDFFAFTDVELPSDSVWKKIDCKSIPELSELDSYHKAKYCKFFPHRLFKNYRYSIWVDGNVQIIADIYPLITRLNGKSIAAFDNPIHDCIYTESRYMVYENRVNAKKVSEQIRHYLSQGFPKHFGMRECSIIIRDHASLECCEIMNEWWEEVNKFTMRDQLSIPYILWKRELKVDYIENLGKNWRFSPRFRQYEHKKTLKIK